MTIDVQKKKIEKKYFLDEFAKLKPTRSLTGVEGASFSHILSVYYSILSQYTAVCQNTIVYYIVYYSILCSRRATTNHSNQ